MDKKKDEDFTGLTRMDDDEGIEYLDLGLQKMEDKLLFRLTPSTSSRSASSRAASSSSKTRRLKRIQEALYKSPHTTMPKTLDTRIQSALELSKAPEIYIFAQRIHDDIEEMRKLHSTEIVGLENVMNIRGMMKTMCQQYKSVMSEISKYCFGILGEPPCRFALVGLGAIAQEDITLHSDFKSVIISEKAVDLSAAEEYFSQFVSLFKIVVSTIDTFLVGSNEIRRRKERRKENERNDLWDDISTPSIKFKVISKVIRPVSDMLKYLKGNPFFIPTCFVYGDEDLFSEFHAQLEKEKQPTFIGKKTFQIILKEFKWYMDTSTDSSKLVTYTYFYKLTSLFLSHIGIYFDIKESNLFDIIEKLHMEHILEAEVANNMRYLVASVCFQRCVFYGNEEGKNQCSMEELRSTLLGCKGILERFLSNDGKLEDILCKSNMKGMDDKKIKTKGLSNISCCYSPVSSFTQFLKLYKSAIYDFMFLSHTSYKSPSMQDDVHEMTELPLTIAVVFELQCNSGITPSIKVFDEFKKQHKHYVTKHKEGLLLPTVRHIVYESYMESLLRFGEMALQHDGSEETRERCQEKLDELRMLNVKICSKADYSHISPLRKESFELSLFDEVSKDPNIFNDMVAKWTTLDSDQLEYQQKSHEKEHEGQESDDKRDSEHHRLRSSFPQDVSQDKVEISGTVSPYQFVDDEKEKQEEAQENLTPFVKECFTELPEEYFEENQYSNVLVRANQISNNSERKPGAYHQRHLEKVSEKSRIGENGSSEPTDLKENFSVMTGVHGDHGDFQQMIQENASKKITTGLNGGSLEMLGCVLDFPQGAHTKDIKSEIFIDSDQLNFPKTAITSIVGCEPPMHFEKPVTITMRTFYTARSEIPVQVLRKNSTDDEWELLEEISLKDGNEIQFTVSHFCQHIGIVSEEYYASLKSLDEGEKEPEDNFTYENYTRFGETDVQHVEFEKTTKERRREEKRPLQKQGDRKMEQRLISKALKRPDIIPTNYQRMKIYDLIEKQEQHEHEQGSSMENEDKADIADNCDSSSILKNDSRVDVWSMPCEKILEEELGQTTKTKKIIGLKGGEIELHGIEVSFPSGAVKEETKFEISVDTNLSQFSENYIAITPVLGCLPSMKFDAPVMITMRTFCSAVEGEEVLAKILYKEEDTDQWTTLHELCLGQENVVQFEVPDFCKYCTLVSCRNNPSLEYHLMNDVFIHIDSALVCSIFYKCLQTRDALEQHMEKMRYQLVARADDHIACVGTKITMIMRRCNPGVNIGEKHFMVTAQNLKKEKNTFYFEVPQNLEQFKGIIKLSYTTLQTFSGGSLPQDIPIHVKWPISHKTESSTQGGITIKADTVATDHSTIHHSSTNSTHHVT